VFVTAFYSFRMYFLVFHGEERFGKAHDATMARARRTTRIITMRTTMHDEVHETHHGDHDDEKCHRITTTGWPGAEAARDLVGRDAALILLAIPSVLIGYVAIEPMLFGSYSATDLHLRAPSCDAELREESMAQRDGIACADHAAVLAGGGRRRQCGVLLPEASGHPAAIQKRFQFIYVVLDTSITSTASMTGSSPAARAASGFLWRYGDVKLIDGLIVNGSAKLIGMLSGVVRHLQSGYIYHYAFSMIIGVFVLLSVRNWFE